LRQAFNANNRAVSLARAQCYLSLKTMKRRFCHRVRVIGILFAFAIAIGPTPFTMATGKNEARVTQAIHNVQLLAPDAAPRPASVNDNVRPRTAVRTGSDSRAELTFMDRTLARLGANSVLSFGEGAFDLANGSILLYLPKSSGGARINTAVATAAGASFTAMAEYRPKSWIKFIILEGRGSVSLKHHPGEIRALRAGQMIMVRPGATKLPEPQDVDLSELIKTSVLVTQFPRLPNLNLILAEANNQEISPPSSPVIDPTGLNTRDQRAAATERKAAPKPR
jgi:FecR protein